MQRISTPTVRIKVYGDQKVTVIGSIVLYMYTSEKTDGVTWQVTHPTGFPILGRTQVKHMNYISYPEIHAPQKPSPVSQDSVKSTDYINSLETMQCSVQSKRAAQSTDSLQSTPSWLTCPSEHIVRLHGVRLA